MSPHVSAQTSRQFLCRWEVRREFIPTSHFSKFTRNGQRRETKNNSGSSGVTPVWCLLLHTAALIYWTVQHVFGLPWTGVPPSPKKIDGGTNWCPNAGVPSAERVDNFHQGCLLLRNPSICPWLPSVPTSRGERKARKKTLSACLQDRHDIYGTVLYRTSVAIVSNTNRVKGYLK